MKATEAIRNLFYAFQSEGMENMPGLVLCKKDYDILETAILSDMQHYKTRVYHDAERAKMMYCGVKIIRSTSD